LFLTPSKITKEILKSSIKSIVVILFSLDFTNEKTFDNLD